MKKEEGVNIVKSVAMNEIQKEKIAKAIETFLNVQVYQQDKKELHCLQIAEFGASYPGLEEPYTEQGSQYCKIEETLTTKPEVTNRQRYRQMSPPP